MRKVLGLATALLGVLALTAVAIAGEAGPSPSGQIQALEVTHSPNKASTKKKKVGTQDQHQDHPEEDRRHASRRPRRRRS